MLQKIASEWKKYRMDDSEDEVLHVSGGLAKLKR